MHSSADPISRFLTGCLDVAFPPACAACGRSTAERCPGDRALCDGCLADLELFDGPSCLRCAAPLASGDTDTDDCPLCRSERWAFDRVVALGPYDGLLRRLVLDGKRPAGGAGAEALGGILALRQYDALLQDDPVCVTPVPQHWSRRIGSRCDGVETLAKAIGRALGLPTRRLLRRVRATPRQTSVAPSDRAANVRRAFAARSPDRVRGRTVLLIDDVLTTGATCSSATRALKQAGARRVAAVVVAKRLGTL